MPIYLIETDAAFEPLNPPAGWYGPVKAEIAVDWIANERQCDETFEIVPEIEFPSERHYRRDDWLCVGVRPTRAMPRGLRVTLESDSASGTTPPGLIENPIECWAGDPSAAERDLADYDSNDGGMPRCTWLFSTDVDSHASNVEPLAYTDDDFVLESVGKYVASDGSFWRILFSPNVYAGASPPLPAEPIASLAIARRTLGRPANKIRSIVLKDSIANECPTVERVPLPFFDDFSPQSTHWRPNGFFAGFNGKVWQPRPNGTATVRIQTGYGPAVSQHRFSGEFGNVIAGLSAGFNNPAGADFYGFTVGPGGGALGVRFGDESIFLRTVGVKEVITGGCGMVYDIGTGTADLFFWDIGGEQGSTPITYQVPGFPSWCALPEFFLSSIWPGYADNILIVGE